MWSIGRQKGSDGNVYVGKFDGACTTFLVESLKISLAGLIMNEKIVGSFSMYWFMHFDLLALHSFRCRVENVGELLLR